jgi:hypothetical protein
MCNTMKQMRNMGLGRRLDSTREEVTVHIVEDFAAADGLLVIPLPELVGILHIRGNRDVMDEIFSAVLNLQTLSGLSACGRKYHLAQPQYIYRSWTLT